MSRLVPLCGLLVLLFLSSAAGATSAPAAETRASAPASAPHASPASALQGFAAAPITVEEYRTLLRAALADLDWGEAGAPRAADRLRGLDTVEQAGSVPLRPALSAVLAGLEARPATVDDARKRLRALVAEVDSAVAAPAATSVVDARGELQGVLGRPEFNRAPRPDPVGDLLRGLKNALAGWLDQILGPAWRAMAERLGDAGGPALPDLSVLFGVVALILVGVLLFWVLRQLGWTIGPSPVALKVPSRALPPTAEALRLEAGRMAEGNDFTGAVRLLYIAVLARWEETGRLAFDRALTNREVLNKARREAGPAASDLLLPLVERFDLYLYGRVAPTSQDYREFAGYAAAAWDTP